MPRNILQALLLGCSFMDAATRMTDALVQLSVSGNRLHRDVLFGAHRRLTDVISHRLNGFDKAVIYTQRGRIYILLGLAADGMGDFEEAVQHSPSYPLTFMFRASISSSFLAELLPNSEGSANDGCTSTASVLVMRAAAYASCGQFALAQEDLQKAIHFERVRETTFGGKSGGDSGDESQAGKRGQQRGASGLTSAAQFVGAGGSAAMVHAWLNAGLAFIEHGNFTSADASATQCLARAPPMRAALYMRACARSKAAFRGRNDGVKGTVYPPHLRVTGALRDYARLIRLDPTDSWAYLHRGRLLLRRKQVRLALYDFMGFAAATRHNLHRNHTNAAVTIAATARAAAARKGKALQVLG